MTEHVSVVARLAGVGLLLLTSITPSRYRVHGLDPGDDVEVPPGGDIDAADGYRLQVIVNREGGTWVDTRVRLEGSFALVKSSTSATAPDAVGLRGGGEATWAPTPSGPALPWSQGGLHYAPSWTLDDGYTSGGRVEMWFDFALDSRSTRDGVPLDIVARLEGDRDGAGHVDVATSRAFVGRYALNPLVHIGQSFTHFSLLGEPGVRLRFEIRMYNNGGAPFRSADGTTASIEWAITAPTHLHTFRIFSSLGDPFDGVNRFVGGSPETPGSDRVSLNGVTFASPSVEDVVADPPASAATSTKEVFQSLAINAQTTAESVTINGYEGYSDTIVLDGFVSCADLELSEALGSRSGPDWQITVGGLVRDVAHDGTVRVAHAAATSPQLPHPDLHALVESCSERGRTHVKVWPDWQGYTWPLAQGLAGVGADAIFLVDFEPPMGVSTLRDAVVVSRLPPGTNVRLKNAHPWWLPPYYPIPGPACAVTADCPNALEGEQCIDGQCGGPWDLRAYYCDTASDFGSAGFVTLETAGDCVPAVMNGAGEWLPPSGMPVPTHLVLHSADMHARAWEDDGLGRARFMIEMTTTGDSAPIMEMTAWLDGTFDLGAFSDGPGPIMTAFGVEPERAPYATSLDQPWLDDEASDPDTNFFEDDGYYRVIDFQCAQTIAHTASTVDLEPGQCAYLVYRVIVRDLSPPAGGVIFRIAGDPAPGDPDPGAAITLPPGVTIDAAGHAYNDAYDIPSPSYPASLPNNGISVTHNALCEPGGTVTEPAPVPPLEWRYEDGCALGWESAGGVGTLISIGFCTDPAYPYEDGQILGFRGRIVAMETGPEAGELCPSNWGGADDGDGVAEPNESGDALFTFRMRVSGNQRGAVVPICDDAGAAFTVTAANEGGRRLLDVVTTVEVPTGATFAGVSDVTPAVGVLVEVSQDGASWSALGSIAAADVRHVRLRGDPAGLELSPYDGLARFVLHLATSLPPGSLLVPSGAMTSDFGTAPLTATPFVVGSCQRLTVRKYFDANANRAQDDGEPALSDWSFTVVDGLGDDVAAGVTGADGTWSILLPAGSYTVHEDAAAATDDYVWSLTTPQDVPVTFVVGGDGATVAFGNRCQCGTDVCAPLACAPLGGQLAQCGDVAPPDCDDGDMCTIDSCDPLDVDGDACVHDAVECDGESGGLFVPVQNGAGELVGAIRCTLAGGVISCDTGEDEDGDGRPDLIVYPGLAGACE